MDDTENNSINNWDELNLPENILRGIHAYGLDRPSPIQCKAITPILEGRNIIAQAQSGTGKTATFCIGALGLIDYNIHATQILIIAPTRELASQILLVMKTIGHFATSITYKLLVGGNSINTDIEDLKKNPNIIVGCPGRICDMLRRKCINTKHMKLLVLDEADEILSRGFLDQILNIFRLINAPNLQVGVFSATISNDIKIITSELMQNPIIISVNPESLTLEGIKQYFVPVENDKIKYEALIDLYSSISMTQSIIFCNSVRRVVELKLSLDNENFPVSAIHSNMTHYEREQALHTFKTGKTRILISSNITARGIDIQQVGIVINFDLPHDVHTYIHRIGRSGRWGRKGIGINFISRNDIFKIKEIEQYYQTQIDPLPNNFKSLI